MSLWPYTELVTVDLGFSGISQISHQRQQETVEARGRLKCIKMDSNQFIQHVKPILQFLQARADQYNCFINLIVWRNNKHFFVISLITCAYFFCYCLLFYINYREEHELILYYVHFLFDFGQHFSTIQLSPDKNTKKQKRTLNKKIE